MSDINLGENEQAVLAAASRLLAGFISANLVTSGNKNKFINASLEMAADMAQRIDDSPSVENLTSGNGETPFP